MKTHRSMALMGSILAIGLLAASAGHADEVPCSYAVPTTGPNGPAFSVGSVNVGGCRFPTTGQVPTSVSFTDRSGGPVLYAIGQDLSGNNALGGPAELEPYVTGCGTTADLSTSLEDFLPGHDTIVRVVVSGGTTSDCKVSLGGTITVNY